MTAEQTPKQPASDTTEPRVTVEDRVERIATYWGRCFTLAWRTVFPRREDTR